MKTKISILIAGCALFLSTSLFSQTAEESLASLRDTELPTQERVSAGKFFLENYTDNDNVLQVISGLHSLSHSLSASGQRELREELYTVSLQIEALNHAINFATLLGDRGKITYLYNTYPENDSIVGVYGFRVVRTDANDLINEGKAVEAFDLISGYLSENVGKMHVPKLPLTISSLARAAVLSEREDALSYVQFYWSTIPWGGDLTADANSVAGLLRIGAGSTQDAMAWAAYISGESDASPFEGVTPSATIKDMADNIRDEYLSYLFSGQYEEAYNLSRVRYNNALSDNNTSAASAQLGNAARVYMVRDMRPQAGNALVEAVNSGEPFPAYQP